MMAREQDSLFGETEQVFQELSLFEFSTAPLPTRDKDVCRVFYNNVNGFEINDAVGKAVQQKKLLETENILTEVAQYSKAEAFLKQMTAWDATVSAVAEHCVEWKEAVPRLVLKGLGKKYNQRGLWTVATSNSLVGNYLKPGGALLYCTEDMTIRLIDKGTDCWGMGRWAYHQYQGRGGQSLLVIAGYRVGQRSGTPGSTTAWHQQKVLLTQQGRNIEPHTAFFTDLEEWVTQKQAQVENLHIAMFLDANEKWTSSSQIWRFATNLNLINLNTAGNFKFPPSHPCVTNQDRSTTIDYCLCSAHVLPCVTYASMVPYDLHTLGDHRGMIVDINLHQLIGGNIDNKVDKVGRKLSSTNVAVTTKYIEAVEKSFNKQNIFERIQKLYYQWHKKKRRKWEIMKKYEKLDAEIYRICLKAEKRSKSGPHGKAEWSPALASAIKNISYWRARKKYQSENLVIKKLGTETGIAYEPVSIETIHENIWRCKQTLNEVQKNSVRHRREFLDDLAAKYAHENNLSTAQAVQELISHESIKNTFSLLREKLTSSHPGQLRELWIARDTEGNFVKDRTARKIITSKNEIHKQLLRRNRQHLRQAKSTPFAAGEWCQALKWDGTGVLGQEILTGTVQSQETLSRTLSEYFDSIARAKKSFVGKEISPVLSLPEYKSFWKKKRESTITSPFGLHVGHYKAVLNHEKILDVHRLMLLIPFQTSIVPSRWRRTVQTMLEKDQGQPWIHRLRIIELFDAQVNAGFQLFIGRRMIWDAVTNKRLHPASYGSTPGKMAASAVLQKILSVDQLRLERRVGGIFDCDATGCYDRIIPPLASIHLQALGLGQQISTFLARLMFMAKRHVKTKHGVSAKGIRTKKRATLYGIGQGNGGGPAIWLAHLTVMLMALSTICTGLVITGLKVLKKLHTVGTGYVDDVTIVISVPSHEPQTVGNIKDKIKDIATTWEQLLFLTGGKLELSKCFWIPIVWGWKQGSPVLKKPSPRNRDLYLLESETHEEILIPLASTADAHKRLGIRFSIDGSWREEYRYWKQFTTEFVKKVKYAKLDRIGGHHTYATIWCSKFRYSSPCIGIGRKRLVVLEKLIIGPSLAAAGYSSKMPRAVVFGTKKYGGMRWESPLSILLTAQISLLMSSIRLNDVVGQMLQIQLEWMQLFAGVARPIMEASTVIPYLTGGWLRNLHELAVEARIQLKIAKLWRPKQRRKNDQIIMDYVHHHFPTWMWEGINACRLYLQAITFSDLTSSDGLSIPVCIYEVEARLRDSIFDFPLQTEPLELHKQYWTHFMNHITDEFNHLLTPLGEWVRHPYQIFRYVIDLQTRHVYKHKGQKQWVRYRYIPITRNRYESTNDVVTNLPKKCVPIRVIEHSMGILSVVELEQIGESLPPLPVKVGIFHKSYQRKVVGQFEVSLEEFRALKGNWTQGTLTLLCGSDGGLKDSIGSSGYVILDPNRDSPLVTGHAAENQADPGSSSTRQELLGQLAVAYWISHLFQVLGDPGRVLTVQLVTDSQASIDIMENLEKAIGLKDYLKPEVEIAMELTDCWRRLKLVEYTVIKVQSHIAVEDSSNETYWKANDIADTLATQARAKVENDEMDKREPMWIPGAKASCFVQGHMVIGSLKDSIQRTLYEENLQTYLLEKYGWTMAEMDTVDWAVHAAVVKNASLVRGVTVTKYIHRWLATKKKRYRHGDFTCPKCFFCDNNEDDLHIFQCAHVDFQEKRHSELVCLWQQLHKNTQPAALQLIRAGIQSVTSGSSMENYQSEFITDGKLRVLAQSQTNIGWDHFLQGRMSVYWRDNGPSVDYDKEAIEWSKNLARLAIQFGLNMWSFRNTKVHGDTIGISVQAEKKLRLLVENIYSDIAPWASEDTQWLFQTPLADRLNDPYGQLVAWVDSIRKLFPSEYKTVHKIVCTKDILGRELEYVLRKKSGPTGL